MEKQYVKKLATIVAFERRITPDKQPMYVVHFTSDDNCNYKKYVSNKDSHWQKMFLNMGQTTPDFYNVAPLLKNRVELVIEGDFARYVNKFPKSALLEQSVVLDVIGKLPTQPEEDDMVFPSYSDDQLFRNAK